jgi:hypothetical protein
MPIPTFLTAALLAAALLLSGRAHAAPPPVEDFFSNAEFGGALLSPSGRHLAAKVSTGGVHDRLAVVDLATLEATIVASFSDGDIGNFQWVSDKRLLFDSTDKNRAPGEVNAAPGLFAVDRDGRHYRQLAERRGSWVRNGDAERLLPWHTYMLPQPGAQDSDAVYVRSVHFETTGSVLAIELLRLDTRTGRATEQSTDDRPCVVVLHLMTDDGTGCGPTQDLGSVAALLALAELRELSAEWNPSTITELQMIELEAQLRNRADRVAAGYDLSDGASETRAGRRDAMIVNDQVRGEMRIEGVAGFGRLR